MIRVLLALLALLSALPAEAQPRRTPLLVEGAQTLTQRVILRPGATLHPRPDAASPRPIPGFSVLHVYARQGEWLEVGREATRAEGWVREAQTIPWRHTMVAAFTTRPGASAPSSPTARSRCGRRSRRGTRPRRRRGCAPPPASRAAR
jgi:hypothetical protein